MAPQTGKVQALRTGGRSLLGTGLTREQNTLTQRNETQVYWGREQTRLALAVSKWKGMRGRQRGGEGSREEGKRGRTGILPWASGAQHI